MSASPRKSVLLDPPQAKYDQLSMLNEVIGKRQEEAEQLKTQLVNLRASIQAEQRQAEVRLRAERIQFQQELIQKREQLSKQESELAHETRRHTAALERIEMVEQDAKQKLFQLQEKEAVFATLAQDRLDTAKLRREVEARRLEAEQLWGRAQALQNEATQKVAEAKTVLEVCEQRNQQMQQEWTKLSQWREELELKSRDYEVLRQTVEQKLTKLEQAEQAKVVEANAA